MIPPPPPQRIAHLDAAADVFENTVLWLPELFVSVMRTGAAMISGRTFRNCLLEGPALMLPLGVDFDSCNFGESGGDMRNLLVRPLGKKVIGSIPFSNCRFVGCTFVAVNFTGDEAFLAMMSEVGSEPGGPAST